MFSFNKRMESERVFLLFSESDCRTDGEHFNYIGVFSSYREALEKIVTQSNELHHYSSCNCNERVKENDKNDKIECEFYPYVIRESILGGEANINVYYINNTNNVIKELMRTEADVDTDID